MLMANMLAINIWSLVSRADGRDHPLQRALAIRNVLQDGTRVREVKGPKPTSRQCQPSLTPSPARHRVE
jgi:hypothetical protein